MAFTLFDRRGKTITPEEMTVEDVIALGLDAVNDRLPQRLLIALARMQVNHVRQQRARAAAMREERRAYGEASGYAPDGLNDLILRAAMAAAAEATVNWAPLLPITFAVPGRDIVTSWGEASVDAHDTRAKWLENMSAGTLRTAVQHRAAIMTIEEHRAANLYEATSA